MKKLISAAKGEIKAELLLKNCRVMNVFTGSIEKTNIAVCSGVIAGLGEYEAEEEIDLDGCCTAPSFIDAHVHIESSMVTPAEYARAVVPRGITTVVADPHEIANVCGTAGIQYMLQSAKDLPLDINFMIPSCVPAAPFENSGAVIDSNMVEVMYKTGKFLGLGEMMNYPGVLNGDSEVISKLGHSGIIDGHSPLLSGKNLNAYLCAGISTDHEVSIKEEFIEKIGKGMYVLMREGTCSKNLETLLLSYMPQAMRRCMFCSDDRYIGDIKEQGTIDYCVKKAVECGISPLEALMMASTNPAECYGFRRKGAIASGYRADIVVFDNYRDMNIRYVFKDGRLVAKDGEALFEAHCNADISSVTATVNRIELNKEMFKGKNTGEKVFAIGIQPRTLITKRLEAVVSSELSKVCVIERHKRKNSYAVGYAANYNICGGAIASTIGHDSHNIIVIGDNDDDMMTAVEALGKNGGIAVCSGGEVKAYLELEIAGLMTQRPFAEVIKQHEALFEAARALGINPEIDPFMTLAFLPLPVIPELRITDKGIFDVNEFKFIGESV